MCIYIFIRVCIIYIFAPFVHTFPLLFSNSNVQTHTDTYIYIYDVYMKNVKAEHDTKVHNYIALQNTT